MAEQLSRMMEHPKSKSTQPKSKSWWNNLSCNFGYFGNNHWIQTWLWQCSKHSLQHFGSSFALNSKTGQVSLIFSKKIVTLEKFKMFIYIFFHIVTIQKIITQPLQSENASLICSTGQISEEQNLGTIKVLRTNTGMGRWFRSFASLRI